MAEYMGKNLEEAVFIIFYLYVSAATIFGTSFLFMWIAARERGRSQMLFGSLERTVILCGLVGVIAHNLVDFAIFEPGVLTVFFSLVACVVAMSTNTSTRQVRTFQLPKPARICGVAICVIIAAGFMRLAFVPTLKADSLKQRAMTQYDQSHELLIEAAAADMLDPKAFNISGRLYLNQFMETSGKDPGLLERSVQMLNSAVWLDPQNFKNYEKLSEVYKLWAEVLASGKPDDAKQKLQIAYDYGQQATELYPGSGRLWFQLAEIEEKLGLKEEAGESYRKAAEIEDAYRAQFLIMYPGRDMVSRLGEYKYQQAKEKSL